MPAVPLRSGVTPDGQHNYMGRCVHCGKLTYRTRKVAKENLRRNHPGEKMSVYPCPLPIDGRIVFHIGHKSAKGKARIRERLPRHEGRDLPEDALGTPGLGSGQSD